MNPFAIFDLPVAFALNKSQLSARYLKLQKSLHPDNFAAHSAQEQRMAMQKSAEINDALHILTDPILRAEAIIQIHTGEVQDLEQKSQRDMAFLMQQLTWREQLESIEIAKNEAELTAFSAEISQENQRLLTEIEQALNTENWQHAAQIADKLRFIKKLIAEIERIEEQLLD